MFCCRRSSISSAVSRSTPSRTAGAQKKNTHTELDFYSKSSWTDECCIILYIQLFIHFLLVAQGEESFHPLRASAHGGVLRKQTASFMSHLCGPLTHELIMALGCMMWACLCLVNGMLVHTLQTRNNAGESTGRFPRERRRDSACRGKFPPKEGFSFPNYGERSEERGGGMGDRRARDTKRPHFRLLSDLRWERWSQATSSTGKAWSQQKLRPRSPERPRGVQFLPDSLQHVSKAKLLLVPY